MWHSMIASCTCTAALKASNTLGVVRSSSTSTNTSMPGAQLQRVQPGLVAEDVAVAREALHARQHGGGRQRHGLGQLEVGEPAVAWSTSRILRSMRSIASSDSGMGR
jgi:hypothetical protein